MTTRLFVAIGMAAMLAVPAGALNVDLHVDSAPNVYAGNSGWDSWWSQAQEDVVDGTFDDMRSGVLNRPGEHVVHPDDYIVYSEEDYGRRLHWIYWVPETTIQDLEGNFQLRYRQDWNSTEMTYDWDSSDWSTELDDGWIEPGSWEEYNDGVIGNFGWAYWATNEDGGYDDISQSDIDRLAGNIFDNQTFLAGDFRWRDDENSAWQSQTLSVDVVPEPASMTLLGIGLAGLGVRRYRNRNASKS